LHAWESFAMQIAGMLLGCLLLAGPHPAQPKEIVAESMLLPANSPITGQPLTLLAALGSTPDRSQQFQIVRAYWRLSQAIADYRFCFDHVKTLGQIKAAARGDASLRLAEAAAAAQLREAELTATRCQYELAEIARLPAGSPLPLPGDRPIVIPYRTSLKELYAGRTPPEQARLADRILPIQRQAIEDRAAAVQAADNALSDASDNLQSNRRDVATAVACSRELLKQQRAFIEAVTAYNRTIADYAFVVLNPAASSQDLVNVLIGPPQQPAGGSVPRSGAAPAPKSTDRPERAASATEPITTVVPRYVPIPESQRRYGQPTPAPPRDEWDRLKALEAANENGLKKVDKDEPALKAVPSATGEPTDTATLPLPSNSTRRTVKKVAAFAPSGATPQYSGLVGVEPAARAKQLAIALNLDRTLPEGCGKALSLTDCLMRDGGANRRATIEAFWLVRQRTAQYQALADQKEMLDSLNPVVLERRSQPSGASDMLRLHAAQAATQAMAREAHVALLRAQYALALRIGAVADAVWPVASTVPHSGDYRLKLEAQPKNLVQSWPVRRLAAMMPSLGQYVQQRAATVVEADVARVAAAEKYVMGTGTIDDVLEGVAAQTEQTSAFLESLTTYNFAITEYAMTVVPPGIPVAKLVGALVAKP
jgi:hypothetical protein